MPIEFSEVITTAAELRRIVGEPSDLVVEKAVHSLDRHSRDFIERSPFMLISSVDSAGNMDISPKGDPIGFVHILDDYTIAIPDRKGNRRTDTFKNILENPRVGLFFMVPGYRETLRISGTALIVRDIALRQPMKIKDVVPDLALVVRIEEMFFHCAKSIIRSGLWDHRNWNDVKGMGTLADALVEQVGFQNDAEVLHTQIEESYEKNLY
tara:strand:+ start:84 stop:713 length:630 start_codon:yes stop_codon:yes gene_type:complete